MSVARDTSRRSSTKRRGFVALVVLLGLALPIIKTAPEAHAATAVSFTILHTNDFHGQLEASGSNPGAARVAAVVHDVRAAKGAGNTLLLDAGDMMQGSLLSNLQKGAPVIAYYRTLGYDAATFGNHEFDWGQTTLSARIAQATAAANGDQTPMSVISANIVQGACSAWTPYPGTTPYQVFTVNGVKVGVIGVSTTETPVITIASATAGLAFCDPADSILHYYDTVKAQSDVVVVLSHLGFTDGGYGYGIPVYGDQTLATKLINAGKPVDLVIGGHSHTNVTLPAPVVTVSGKAGSTTVVQAYYNGRQVGEADMTFDPSSKAVTVAWQKLAVSATGAKDSTVDALVTSYASDPAYQATINQPVGYAQTDLLRNYNGDSMMADFVDDAIVGSLNHDAATANDVDVFFNNAGGIRTDWCDAPDPANPGSYVWSNDVAQCSNGLWAHAPMLLNYGQMFTILPFGNATVVGQMTGAQILELLNQSATLGKGALQTSGLTYKFYRYSDAKPGPQPYAWGAYDVMIGGAPLDLTATYKVGTNEFLAPAGGDNFAAFKYMTSITYWGDMLDQVNAYVAAAYTLAAPYKGPTGDGSLDGRITRDGTDATGSIIPLTVLHHNDSHGNLLKGSFVGYDQLATLINQERLHNPSRTLLVSGGDNIQGDAMMYYFRTAPEGHAADGTTLPSAMTTNPLVAAFNAMGYDAVTLGNHEFNFGSTVFVDTMKQATYPVLQANVVDSGAYGLAAANVKPFVEKTLDGIKVAILGIGNHRVPSYELPSNIPGLTFTNPIDTGKALAPGLAADNDVVIALTHIGFTTNPKSVEVDNNVDTAFAAQVPGIDAVIGAHSHTNPASPEAPFKYLPTIVAGPNGAPVEITQAYRYNNTLGEVVLGLRAKAGGGYEVVARAGQYLTVTMSTPEDPTVKAIVQPYQDLLNGYNNKVVGQTTAPIDTLAAFTQETNGANLQADASVFELGQHGIAVDVHLSGAMTNKLVAVGATSASPYTLKVSDMFAAMPYENSLVVMTMNGPQLKRVLERAYRNYYYYKYVPGYGGYSYYTTCMLDTSFGDQITYADTSPTLPNGNNVVSLLVDGRPVDFADASTYYRVSTVNYLAAGACNFSDNGTTLWPLGQITNDTQFYVRDAVIDYVTAKGTVSPAIEGRLAFTPLVNPPSVVPEPSLEGATVTATATFTDPYGPRPPYTCAVDFGDGSGWLPGVVTGSTCTSPTHAYAAFGTYTVKVVVSAAGQPLGWSSGPHVVRFAFSGFFPPLKATGNTAKAGSAIPVKFSLGGERGLNIFLPGSPSFRACGGGTATPADGKLSYEPTTKQYSFVWKTPKGLGGCQKFTMNLVDGTSYVVEVSFKS